jgi:chorismate mutase
MKDDPQARIDRLRDEISSLDRAILDAVNARLELVAELKRHKQEQGIAFVDPERERKILDDVIAANQGPLSEDGVRELFREVLGLMKREVSGDGRPR